MGIDGLGVAMALGSASCVAVFLLGNRRLLPRTTALVAAAWVSFGVALMTLTVAWSSLLLLLPLAFIPFSNMIPALSLGLVGAGLVARKSLFSWLGMVLSGGFTALLILLGEALILAAQGLLTYFT